MTQTFRSEAGPKRAQVIGLGVAIVMLLIVGAVAAATDDGDDADLATTSVDGPTTTTLPGQAAAPAQPEAGDPAAPAPPIDDAGSPAPDGPSTTAPPETTATTQAPAPPRPSDEGGAQDPGPVVPPRSGVYRYKTVSTVDGERNEEETRDVWRETGREGDVVLYDYDAAQGGVDAQNKVRWEPTQVLLTFSTFDFNGQDAECDWDPDHPEAMFPMSVGQRFEFTSTCQVSGFGPTPVNVTRSTTREVVALERHTVLGQKLDVWVVNGTDHIEFSTIVIDTTTTSWFSPKHGVSVYAEGTGSGSNGTESGEGRFVREILNLDPE